MTAARYLAMQRTWKLIDTGARTVGVAERAALGTSARVAAWPAHQLARVLAAVDTELALLDQQASRFRPDSEISAACRDAGGGSRIVSEGLAEAIAVALAGSTLIAQRSLYDHVTRVADALDRDGLAAGRAAVAHIVGRDPDRLDAAGVARAAIESLAENFSDAVVAPALWLIVGGLAGGAVYKAINTADSMIGHRTPRHQAFGWAAARLDDLVNLPASRLAGLLIVAAAAVSPRLSARAAAAEPDSATISISGCWDINSRKP